MIYFFLFHIVLCFLSSGSFIQHVWVGSYDFDFRFLGIPSCDCLCFTAIYCAWVVELSEIVHSLFPMHQFMLQAIFFLSESGDFKLVSHREIVVCL